MDDKDRTGAAFQGRPDHSNALDLPGSESDQNDQGNSDHNSAEDEHYTSIFQIRGSTYGEQYQNNLKEVQGALKQCISVPIRLLFQKDNPKDKHAISVNVTVNSKDRQLGYIGVKKIPKVADRILIAEARRRNTQMSCLTEVPSIPKDHLLQKYSDGNAVYIKDLNVKLKHCLDHWKSQSSNSQLPVKNPTIQEFIKTQQWPNLTVSVVKDVGRDEMEEEHPYTKNSKKRFLVQSTKKMDCKSQITLKAVVKFPDFKIDGLDSTYRRKKCASNLRAANFNHVKKDLKIVLILPDAKSHQNHLIEFQNCTDSAVNLAVKREEETSNVESSNEAETKKR
ncbi:unnamed protein product [Mytilus edulis]|uniref:Uncharacterized protein n=1 Tax=Mytilus edulis TaxID=6550 RepID=A0A8S3QC84_MYTED|nr:unnamed protein product [Mytilus edulis]